MRNKKAVIGIILCLVMLASTAFAVEQETNFDRWAYTEFKKENPSYFVLVENNHPSYKDSRTVEQIYGSLGGLEYSFAQMWYNLYEGELAQGIAINDSFAVDIYKGIKSKNVLVTVTAEDNEAICINYLVGVFNKKKQADFFFGHIYWIEWNTEEQKLRATKDTGSIRQLKNPTEILNEFKYSSYVFESVGVNPIDPTAKLPTDSFSQYWVMQAKDINILNEAYALKNDGKKPTIK